MTTRTSKSGGCREYIQNLLAPINLTKFENFIVEGNLEGLKLY